MLRSTQYFFLPYLSLLLQSKMFHYKILCFQNRVALLLQTLIKLCCRSSSTRYSLLAVLRSALQTMSFHYNEMLIIVCWTWSFPSKHSCSVCCSRTRSTLYLPDGFTVQSMKCHHIVLLYC